MSHAPRPHLVEARRLEAVLADGPADDGVEPDVRDLLAVVDPDLGAVVLLDDARRPVGEPGGHAPGERVRRLDDVVVDGDHRVLPVPPLRLGQERDAGAALAPVVKLVLASRSSRSAIR